LNQEQRNAASGRRRTKTAVRLMFDRQADGCAMDKVEARRLLDEQLAAYRSQGYEDLAKKVSSTIAFQTLGPSGVEYNVEVMFLWDSPGKKVNVRVIAAVDDGQLPRALVPMSDSFIVTPDGSFLGE